MIGSIGNISGGCSDFCGDQRALLSSCDLGFGNEYDGCTDDCEVENNFSCYTEINEDLIDCFDFNKQNNNNNPNDTLTNGSIFDKNIRLYKEFNNFLTFPVFPFFCLKLHNNIA